ncbi:MAG: sigma-54-dependent transcriptional regulator [Rhabdochlamydiaceae bacterium]
MALNHILIIEDDPLMKDFLKEIFTRRHINVSIAENLLQARQTLLKETFDLILSDIQLPDGSGLDLLSYDKRSSSTPIIMMTAFGSVQQAVEAMNRGAFSYIIKPFELKVLDELIHKINASKSSSCLKWDLLRTPHDTDLFLSSAAPSLVPIIKDLDKIASSQASVFIYGESGTGKEIFSQSLHQFSLRQKHPFIKVNCAAIPESLMESEFFGHEKGAFTGAIQKRIGRFELAHKGTLLLDEISEIPLSFQAKLLRIIQEKEFERVGSCETKKIDVRLISTSNRDMEEAIASKLFREDLFFRLNVIPIHLPPLRERKEDIIALVNFFVRLFCQQNHKTEKPLSPKLEKALLDYYWPGNIRELKNMTERAVIMSNKDHLEDTDFLFSSPWAIKQDKWIPQGITIKELEKKLILKTLNSCQQNKTKTASALGISIRTLRNKLVEYQL